MAEAIQIADPLGEARDVLEAFRSCDVVVPDWSRRLAEAADALDQLPAADTDIRHRSLINHLRELARGDLVSDRGGVARAADEVARLRRDVDIDGLVRPDDDYWGFD